MPHTQASIMAKQETDREVPARDASTEHADYLRYLTYSGAVDRYGIDPIVFESPLNEVTADEEYIDVRMRLDHELGVIEEAGYPTYFLIVADLLRYCREQSIPTGPGRGSVCGSAVAYATGITDVDPLRWGIPFERFLHLERIAMPDVDLDICQSRRQEVIDYLRETYGHDNVAQIITFGTLMARGVVRDAWRVLHVEDEIGVKAEEVIALIPEGSGADQVNIAEYIETEEGRNLLLNLDVQVIYNGRPVSVLDHVLRLEGTRRHSSVHAAGVVIADRPLIEIAPLYRKNKDAEVQIQFDLHDAEEIGLLKFDVLGLRTITVIGDAEALVRRTDPHFSIKEVSLDDRATFDLLSVGDTGGIFQLEGEGITGALTGIRPDRFEDIVALLALYRPGPMEQLPAYIHRKHGEERVEYAHLDLEPVLSSTYGLIVYQEQVMGMARIMAGYTAGQADMFRKAIGKKLPELIREEIGKFKAAALERGYDEKLLDELGQQIAYFGRYGFNLGHATGYAYITYWTAYLKANHPVEFYTALLNSYTDDAAKLGNTLREVKKRGIEVRPPDINLSGRGFTVAEQQAGRLIQKYILFGLAAVHGLGDSAVTDIIEERDSEVKNGYSSKRVKREKDDGREYMANIRVTERVPNTPRLYESVWDFCRRLTHVPVNVKQSLAVAGAFGSDVEYRKRLYEALPDLNAKAKAGKKYDLDTWVGDVMSDLEMARAERKAVGFYVTSHPLQMFGDLTEMYGAVTEGVFEELPGSCVVAGMVIGVRVHQARNGEMAWVTVENDIMGMPDITIFASNWNAVKQDVKKDAVIIARGTRDVHPRFGVGFKAEGVQVLDRARPKASVVRVTLPDGADEDDLDLLMSFFTGSGPVWQVIVQAEGRAALIATNQYGQISGAILSAFKEMGWEVSLNEILDGGWVPGGPFATKRRTPIWEVPFIALAAEKLDGKITTEIERE